MILHEGKCTITCFWGELVDKLNEITKGNLVDYAIYIDSSIDFLLPTGILRPFLSGLIGIISINSQK